MDKKAALLKLIPEQGIVPLYYAKDPGVSIRLMKALYEGGFRTTEYADRGEKALANFKEMRKACDAELPGMYLGIGTVKNESSAQAYIDAGAEFIICPGIFESISEIAERNKLLCVPGGMTVTDIMRAEATGATIVKLFPANNLGPEYIDTIRAIFPGLSFLPTGGIELSRENLTGWIKSGVCAVGGSKLLTKAVIENELYEELTKNARQALELFQNIKNSFYPTNKIEISISQ